MVRKVHKYADGGKIVPDKPKPKSFATPGVKGAIKDAIEATAKSAAPKSITQRKHRLDKAIEDAGG